jgi:hypothetical protein
MVCAERVFREMTAGALPPNDARTPPGQAPLAMLWN